MSFITVSGLCPRDARFISFTRVLVVDQRLFSVGLGGASRRAPLDLPVLIPRVKNGLPRGTRAALCERQSPQLPTKAVAPPVARPAGDRYAVGGYARDGCVCAPCRPSAAVSATQGESRRLRRRKKSAAVSVLTSSPETPSRFSCPRNPLSSGFNFALSCGRGLTRPSIAAVRPCGARRPAVALVVARCAPRVAAPSGDRCAVGGYSMPRQTP